MATLFTTTITECRVTSQGDLSDVVREVNCLITGTDSVLTQCTFELPVMVSFGPADPGSFTPFEDITQDEMVAWVEAQTSQIGPVQAHIDSVVQKEVALAELQPMPLPWGDPTPVPVPPVPVPPSPTPGPTPTAA